MTGLRRYAVTAVALSLLLAGCTGSTRGSSSTGAQSGSPSVSASPGSPGLSRAPAPSGAPGPGALSPVPARTLQVLPAVPLQSPASFGGGVTARVTATAPVTAAGSGPGQISGAPAVAFTLAVDNASGSPVPLDLANVTVTYGADRTPALPVDGDPGRSFPAAASPRSSATAVYVFAVPDDQRSDVTLTLRYSVDRPTVVFTGGVR